MDVFKIHVGEGRAIAISRENYFMETKGMEPYVVERDGHRTFYAVCPECDNPIQLIGLNRRELDAGHRRPYGKHVGHDVPGVAVYDETAYLECSYSNPGYHRDPGSRRPPSNPTALALYRIMRDRFDRVEYAWRRASGIRLGIKRLRRALTLWRNDKAWLNYDSTYCNLPQMLFMGSPEQDLYGQCVSKDSGRCGSFHSRRHQTGTRGFFRGIRSRLHHAFHQRHVHARPSIQTEGRRAHGRILPAMPVA